MKNLFKKIKDFIFKNKKFFFIGIFLFIFLFFILFPYDDAIKKIIIKIVQSSSFQIQYNSSSVGIFPPHVSLEGVEITIPKFFSSINSDKVIIQPAYTALLAFKPGAKFQFHFGKSNFNLWFKKLSSKNNTNSVDLKVYSKYLELQHLSFFSPFFNNANGILEFFLNLNIDLKYHSQPEGFIQFNAKDVKFNSYSFTKKYIGTINLPPLKWKFFNGKINTSKGRMNFENVVFGGKTDPIYLYFDGFLNILWNRFGTDLKNYNIEMDLQIDQEMKSQLFFIDLFEIFFPNFEEKIEEKISENRIQYKAKITGQSFYPPKIQKIKNK